MIEKQAILLVDDSENDLFIMRKAFEKAQFNHPVYEVYNGVEAISFLRGDPPYNDREKYPLPTVMIMDLNMPKQNGFDVLGWLKLQPGLKRLPVMLMTASVRSEDVDKAFDLGANAFLVKPSTLAGLTDMIRCLHGWIQSNRFPTLTLR
jgi:CheY-like chemotaxis protein